MRDVLLPHHVEAEDEPQQWHPDKPDRAVGEGCLAAYRQEVGWWEFGLGHGGWPGVYGCELKAAGKLNERFEAAHRPLRRARCIGQVAGLGGREAARLLVGVDLVDEGIHLVAGGARVAALVGGGGGIDLGL